VKERKKALPYIRAVHTTMTNCITSTHPHAGNMKEHEHRYVNDGADTVTLKEHTR